MGFLNGVFLFALGAMVLPVVIHILNRRRLRKVRFSSLEFIDDLNKRRMSKINLRRWIVLLLRTLAVVFLVLAFARPTVRAGAALFARGGAPKHVVVCLDRSYSMGVEQEQGTVFTEAREVAKRIIDECADNDAINVVQFSTRAEALFENGTRNRSAVQKTLDGVTLAAEGTSYAAAVQVAAELARASGIARSEIYLVSDFRDAGDTLSTGALPEGAKLILVPVLKDAVDNVSIDRVLVPRKLIRPGEAVRIGVAVTNHSRERPAEVPLELLIDGKRKAQKLVAVPAAASVQTTFVVSMTERGTYRGRITKNRDRLHVDDDRYFVLDISAQIPVTLVRGRTWAQGEPGANQAAYFFIDKALNPRRSAQAEFRVDVVDQNALAVANLPDRGVVVWTDPEAVDSRRFELVKRYVHGGGSLLLFLGNDPRAGWRDPGFARYLGIGEALAEEVTEGVRLVSFAGDHATVGMFDEEELQLVSQSRVTRYVAVRGVPADSVIARFDRGRTPAMWECRRGRGRILVVATSPDLAGGNLPLSPMFLPLVHASVSYLAQAGRADARDEHLVGGDLVFELPPRWSAQTAALRVRTERGGEVKPVVSAGRGERTEVLVADPREVGFYTLLADTAQVDEVGVNVDTRESNLNPLPLDDAGQGGAAVIDAGADLAGDIRRETEGREVFVLFLALAAAALVAEAVLGRKA